MMSRKEFLKSTGGVAALAAISPLTSLLAGCAPSAQTIQGQVVNDKIVIPLANLPDLTQPDSFTKVFVGQATNPIILFHEQDSRLQAVLSTCSHNGCEVRKVVDGFTCPCHGSRYDLRGNVLKGPASEPLERYRVERFSDRVELILESPQ